MKPAPAAAPGCAAAVLAEVSRQVRDGYPAAKALIVTGSTARDEATILYGSSAARWLSDVEAMVVVPDAMAPSEEDGNLARVARQAMEELERRGVRVTVELKAVRGRLFPQLKPLLFSYELRQHGRQMFGDCDYLSRIPPFTWRDIPREDAWRLLSNRMVEWLEFQYEQPGMEVEAAFYVLVKLYLDLITSLSLVAGRYTDRYATRSAAVPEMAAWLDGRVRGLDAGKMAEAASLCAEYKLNPGAGRFAWLSRGTSPGGVRELLNGAGYGWMYDDLFAFLSAVWEWELSEIAGRPLTTEEETRAFIARLYGWRFRLRGWGKLALYPEFRSPGRFWGRLPRLFWAGTPRALVYFCAWSLLRAGRGGDGRVLGLVERHVPVLYRAGASGTWEALSRQCVLNWKTYLRRAYV